MIQKGQLGISGTTGIRRTTLRAMRRNISAVVSANVLSTSSELCLYFLFRSCLILSYPELPPVAYEFCSGSRPILLRARARERESFV